MKARFLILFIAVVLSAPIVYAAGEKESSNPPSGAPVLKNCLEKSSSVAHSNECAQKDLDQTRMEMSKILADIEKRYAEDVDYPEAHKKLAKLRKAQKSWETFMQSQLDFLYFGRKGPEGSLCYGLEAIHLVQLRIEQLKQWVDNNVEGNVCGGL